MNLAQRLGVRQLLVLIVLLSTVLCYADKERMYNIKASYIYNVMKFVTWTDERLPVHENIQVGLLGDDPIVDILFQQLSRRQVQSRNISVHKIKVAEYLSDSEKMQYLHVIYISKELFTEDLKAHLTRSSSLLLSSYHNFIADGGMISIIYNADDDQVGLDINLQAVQKQEMIISSRLLDIASINNH